MKDALILHVVHIYNWHFGHVIGPSASSYKDVTNAQLLIYDEMDRCNALSVAWCRQCTEQGSDCSRCRGPCHRPSRASPQPSPSPPATAATTTTPPPPTPAAATQWWRWWRWWPQLQHRPGGGVPADRGEQGHQVSAIPYTTWTADL